jgi:hypothetical protein
MDVEIERTPTHSRWEDDALESDVLRPLNKE